MPISSLPQGLFLPPRTTTLYVAAANASDRARAQADFLCTGVNDHLVIQAALDALPAADGMVFLSEGTFNCEATINLDTNQTLRGCGRNTILTTATADLVFLSAVGGAGTELTGIVIADLQIDGGAGAISECGIRFVYVDYSLIQNVYLRRHNSPTDSVQDGIYLFSSDFNTIINNICQENGTGIYLDNNSNDNTVTGNTCQGNGSTGICLLSSNDNTVIGNTCQGNDIHGIYFIGSGDNTVTGNTCQGNGGVGLYLNSGSNDNTVTGNTCQGNGTHGIAITTTSNDNTVNGNTCIENSQSLTNDYADIYLSSSDYNNIQGNTCRAGGLANVPRYGINISNAACDGNLVINNDLHDDGFGTAPFNDAGTGTRLNTYKVPFSDGSDPQDSGYLIDAATEMARAWLRLPDKVAQVVRMKVYAVSGIAEADEMRLEFVIYGGADNEAFDTHDGSIANHPSISSNFALHDIIYWTVTTDGVLALTGGDSIMVHVIYEDAGDGDCATDAYIRTVEIEYV